VRSVRARARRFVQDLQRGLFSVGLSMRRRWSNKAFEAEGATVIIVTWNTRTFLSTALKAIDRFSTESPPHVIVVDNASDDGTIGWLRETHPRIQVIRLKRNVGHGLALDAGIQAARTKYVIALDVDAFPIDNGWLDAVLNPLAEGCTLVGAEWGDYIHPCFCAIARRRFLDNRYTFDASYTRNFRVRKRGWPSQWDAGQLISALDPGPVFGIPVTSVRGPHVLGTTFGDVVYHHFYATRHFASEWLSAEESALAWREAVNRYLPANCEG
jgi:glycosyltransferase involved in cell wall biosynthesis